MKNFYITSPIYYVNDKPHIGHAYTSIICDVIARYKRLDDYNVLFLTGTDEHGQKVEKSAMAKKMSPTDFTDLSYRSFFDLTKYLNLSNDDFIRTTEKRHINSAKSLWNKLFENGHIYLSKYSGWYSVRDEAFYSENEIINGLAPTGSTVEWVEEESYFFNLSKWSDKLLELYENNDFIRPKSCRNEIISFVKSGLKDLSISRTSFSWGIDIDQNDKHVMYVWLDALSNYLSAIDYPDISSEKFRSFWPPDIHIIGKDIARFHAIYWPAFLMAADLPVPKAIFAHGWWTINGEKMSKSIGNVINPIDLIDEFGIDQLRYFLIREINFGNDGNYSKDLMINRVNSELSNNIGNLCQRSLTMIYKNANKSIPKTKLNIDELYDQDLLRNLNDKVISYKNHMDNYEPNQAIDIIISIANDSNIFIDNKAPWILAKTNIEEMNVVLYILAETIRYIAIMLLPFIPKSANLMLDQLSIDNGNRKFSNLEKQYHLIQESLIEESKPIFTRFK